VDAQKQFFALFFLHKVVELIDGLYMPRSFSDNTTKIGRAEKLGYEIKIASYSQRMDELQERQRELKATVGRFAEVKYRMDAFKEHVHSGEKMDTTDAVVLRQFTDRIVVYDDRLEIHLRIGGTLEQRHL